MINVHYTKFFAERYYYVKNANYKEKVNELIRNTIQHGSGNEGHFRIINDMYPFNATYKVRTFISLNEMVDHKIAEANIYYPGCNKFYSSFLRGYNIYERINRNLPSHVLMKKPIYNVVMKNHKVNKETLNAHIQENYFNNFEFDPMYPLNVNQTSLLNIQYILTHRDPNTFLEENKTHKLKLLRGIDIKKIKDEISVSSFDYTTSERIYYKYRDGMDKRSRDVFAQDLERSIYIFENQNYFPRLYFVNQYKTVENDFFRELFGSELDLSKTALFDQDYDKELREYELNRTLIGGQMNDPLAEIIEDSPNRIKITTKVDSDCLMILTDQWAKNWQAYVDGQEKTILRVYYTFRALPLKRGNHAIVFQYKLPYLNYLIILSLFSWVTIIFFLIKLYLSSRSSYKKA